MCRSAASSMRSRLAIPILLAAAGCPGGGGRDAGKNPHFDEKSNGLSATKPVGPSRTNSSVSPSSLPNTNLTAQAPTEPILPSPPAAMQGRNAAAETVTALVFVGETLGWVEPCGCTEGMLGGLPRRAAFVKALRTRGYDPVILDLGDLIRDPGRQAELKLDAIAKAYARMPVRAVAIGERDLPYLGQLDRAPIPTLRAVAGDRRTIETLAGRISVASAVGPSLRAHYDAAGVTAPLEATPTADVVLFHGTREEARRLFARKPGVLVVYAGHDEEFPAPAERLPGGALVVSTGDKGKYAALLLIRKDPTTGALRAEAAGITPLGDRIADDPEVAKIVDDYKMRLYEENLITSADRKLPESGGSYVGPEACGACHKPQYEIFEKTKHFHAFESLAPRKGTRDPECLRCHVTGAGYASGFAGPEATPDLARVSCEACHGVGSNHVKNPQPGFGAIKSPRTFCLECHDKENSPRFDFDVYWPRIKH